MGKRKDLSDFDKGQIVMARRLGQSISKTAALAGCSRSAVVSTYQKWSKEGKAVNRRQGHGRPRLIDARGERRLARVVQSNKRATVGQIAEKVNAGSDRKVSEHTVHRSLLRMGLRRRRPVRVPMLTCKDDQEEEKEQSTLPMPPDRVEYQKDKEQEQSTPLSPPDQVDYKEKENKEQSISSSPLRNVSLSPNADLTPDPPGATTGPCGPPSPSDLCRSDDVF